VVGLGCLTGVSVFLPYFFACGGRSINGFLFILFVRSVACVRLWVARRWRPVFSVASGSARRFVFPLAFSISLSGRFG
jgi:hypothetical protein